MIYKMIAEEDIRYRLMSSYPPEGFLIPDGDFIFVQGDILPHLKVRSVSSKRRGRYRLEIQCQ